MSMSTWVNYGIGVCVSDLELKSLESVEKLISMAPQFEEKVKDIFADLEITKPNLQDYLELDQDHQNGIAYILQEVINETNDITVTACDDLNQKRYLIFQPLYPWQMTEFEKTLDKPKLEAMLTKYISVITDDNFDVDDISAENYG